MSVCAMVDIPDWPELKALAGKESDFLHRMLSVFQRSK